MIFLSFVGLGILLLVLISFFRKLGATLPIPEFLLSIAGLQWILGPILAYDSPVQHYKYHMYVSQEEYMAFVVPAYGVFAGIMLLLKKDIYILGEQDLQKYSSFGKKILLIGILADVFNNFAPASLGFFLFLLAQLKFIGAGLLLFSPSRKNRWFFYVAIAYLFISSLSNAMFHDFLLWGSFFFMIWALKYNPGFYKKLLILLGALVLIISIQTAKSAFREQVWSGYQGDKISLFIEILDREFNNADFTQETEQQDLNIRLNQGWIISAVMKEVPANEPFAQGTTVQEAVSASLLPRFLAPDKKTAGGQDNFMKYTGLDLGQNTSMGLSVLGEAYANFGGFGGIWFMFLYGLFLIIVWNKIITISTEHPLLIFFIPLLFFQVVKAETELVVVLNHLVKAGITVVLFFWFSRKYLKWEI